MSSRWKKIIWAVFMVQLCLVHLALWYRYKGWMDSLFYRAARHFELPGWLYGAGGVLVLFGVLGVGMAGMVLFFLRYRRFRRTCIRSVFPVEDEEIYRQFYEECESVGISENNRRRIFYSGDVASPFVLGFRKPLLLLPGRGGEMDEADRGNLELIFRHECIHVKQKDTLYKLFMLICNCLLWFQPLAYVVRYLSYRDIEIACDEAAVSGRSDEERARYGQFLIDHLRRGKDGNYAYSAFFLGGKKLMKARIGAVMGEKHRLNFLAGLAVAAMFLEICAVGAWLGRQAAADYTEYKESKEPVNIYEGYERPEGFTVRAVENMLIGTPREEMDYSQMVMAAGLYEQKESFAELPCQAEGPWQVRLRDANRYGDCLDSLFTRYIYAGRDQQWGSQWDPEQAGSYTGFDITYQRLLAGDGKEAVWAVVFKEYNADYQDMEAYQEGWAQASQGSDGSYLYYPVAMHVKMVKDYVFELAGICGLEEAMEAFRDAYPDTDYSDVPKLDLWKNVSAPGSGYGVVESYDTRISEDKLWIRRGKEGEAEWEPVPVTLEEVFERGDDMEGKLTRLQEGSYQCDERKIIFAYGGSYSAAADFRYEGAQPVTVEYLDEESGAWRKSVVTDQYLGGRKIFISFPEDSRTGFLLMTTERVMWQEGTWLFGTRDGGAAWEEIGPAALESMSDSHSLTTDAVFLSNEVGFLTIRSSDVPDIWRTGDGGLSWQPVVLEEVPEYYCMAYAPEIEDGKLVLYVGMEEYSEYGGSKARYVSEDEGLTWKYQGLVMRQ